MEAVKAAQTYLQWLEFGGGVGLGSVIELSTNVSDQCLSTVATALQSAYLVYFYLSYYLSTNEEDNVAYAVSYLLKMMRSGYNISACSSYLTTITNIFTYRLK